MLITGFEPFAAAHLNPSWEAAHSVAAQWDGSATVVAVLLPVEFAAASRALNLALRTHAPDVVISLGLAEGRRAVTPERIAINIADARIPDNAGSQPIDVPVVEGAADGLMSTLPVKAIVQDIRAAGIPSALSHSAGTYVCNHVFYSLQHALRQSPARSGFIHVPATPEMGLSPDTPTMEQTAIDAAVRVAIETSLARTSDAVVTEGTVH